MKSREVAHADEKVLHTWTPGDETCPFAEAGHEWAQVRDDFIRNIERCEGCLAIRPPGGGITADWVTWLGIVEIPDPHPSPNKLSESRVEITRHTARWEETVFTKPAWL